MPSSDAILLGEDFISEHFFTTDATSQSFQARVVAVDAGAAMLWVFPLLMAGYAIAKFFAVRRYR